VEGYVLGVEFLSFGEFALVLEHHGGVLEIPERMERGPDAAADTEPGTPGALTPRERDLLQLLAEGKNNREIAERLSVSLSTVRRDIDHMIRVLGVRSRDEVRDRPATRGTG
jgi:DNA-binding NarL/FixJ family response regulator